jgi:putative ABC transport system permease protein
VYHPLANFFSNNDKPGAIIPYETGRRKLLFGVRWMDLTVKPRDGVPRDVAMDEVTAALRVHRHLRPSAEDTWFLYGQDKVMDLYNSTVQIFFIVVLTLSAIGLLVGGVGVIAIMMISVTERTREIGVRKALGAQRRDVLLQFLTESVAISGAGSAIGVLVGLASAFGVTAIIRASANAPFFHAGFSWITIAVAVASALGIGLAFGTYPALRAARMSPIEAIRHE